MRDVPCYTSCGERACGVMLDCRSALKGHHFDILSECSTRVDGVKSLKTLSKPAKSKRDACLPWATFGSSPLGSYTSLR